MIKGNWICSKCGNKSKGSIFVSTGYCKKCKKHELLHRFDSLN